MSKKYLITVIGPTAIGKTSLSIKLAQHFKTAIISCDSRQFYKEMSIGTAVPNEDELAAVPHHFIQDRSIFDDYSVGQFEKDAIRRLDELFKKNNVVVMVGGSGLYVDAVLKGLDDFPDITPEIRERLKERYQQEGIIILQEELKVLDPIIHNKIDLENHQRVIRALEVCIGTGRPYSSFLTDKQSKRNFRSIKIGLTTERDILYERINSRVDLMLDHGLLEEVKQLQEFKDLNALQTVGYKELFQFLAGSISFEQAVAEIKKNTRRFAKRQGTWFRKDPTIQWFDHQEAPRHIIDYLTQQLKS